ncbi:dimethyl sulfoxide reductase anchor subunit family protein [Pseudophaeobacter flagellatus]|uniref:dimethyl sulfoxide reductase anchor subunit family protein n=1 Tax=Pseudophaeobacter flagellatus TaxID=2899119 RepID=UPI001E30AAF4|nr:DmsC/YnfH family molybdoenzyme membrane anchor subunit [Pseudophaeobacter flagellatus]MCD9148034.1 dimethyl sulfoxide reductase anchor subunit [Pseudophaeobacter flagellatus]
MHPAPSVILFTTLSGFGFGLLVFLGLGYPGVTGWMAFVFYAIAYGLAVGGLLASTFHLGRPERALKAFRQWTTSWLSREGICAIAALLVMGLYAFGAIFMDRTWPALGVIGAVLSLGTVFTTSMIYCQLKTVPRWNMPLTPVVFLSFSLAGGALLAGQESLAIWLLLIAGAVQLAYWWQGDKAFAASGTTMASATGLGGDGATLRAFEPPHTGSNYLLREFVHVVGRKHAQKLRAIALVMGFILPVLLLVLPVDSNLVKHLMAALAVVAHMSGVAVSRWLFFAQAEHVVGLYYGKR